MTRKIIRNGLSTNRLTSLKRVLTVILFLLMGPIISSCQSEKDFMIINPYASQKEFPYKASLHNHTQFHPEYTHATVPAPDRLKDYRDYDTYPPYGIVSITDHNRVTTPWSTNPSGVIENNDSPWGVENILWLPGNEAGIGSGPDGGLRGHMVVINASTSQTDEPDWIIEPNPLTANGWLYLSDEIPASVHFSGTAKELRIIATRLPSGGIAKVFINNTMAGEIDYYAADTLYQQVVFSYSADTITPLNIDIEYSKKGKSKSKYMGTINLDRIELTIANELKETIDANNDGILYEPLKYDHTILPARYRSNGEEAIRRFSDEGCFLILAHPNSRLETEGENKGKQLWNSSGYIFDELDIIFGNEQKGIEGFQSLPHALEIGNRGYDFSIRTNFTNAEEKWDYVLKQGHRVWGTASDDSHGQTPREGWIVVFTNAPEAGMLTRADAMESLFSGNFYASQGPNMEIDLTDNQLTISTDKPSVIEFITKDGVVLSNENTLKSSYTISGAEVYVRARVTREERGWRKVDGGIGRTRSAWTNPFYIIKNE